MPKDVTEVMLGYEFNTPDVPIYKKNHMEIYLNNSIGRQLAQAVIRKPKKKVCQFCKDTLPRKFISDGGKAERGHDGYPQSAGTSATRIESMSTREGSGYRAQPHSRHFRVNERVGASH